MHRLAIDCNMDDKGEMSAPAKLTIKMEAFCLAYIEEGKPSDAYRASYNAGNMSAASVSVAASKLLADPRIALRVAELRSAHVERHNVTVDDIRRMLEEDRNFARDLEKPAAAVSATMGIAKLYGHMTEKVETKHSGAVEITTKDQRDAAVAAALRADK